MFKSVVTNRRLLKGVCIAVVVAIVVLTYIWTSSLEHSLKIIPLKNQDIRHLLQNLTKSNIVSDQSLVSVPVSKRVTTNYSERQHLLNTSTQFSASQHLKGTTTSAQYLLQNKANKNNRSRHTDVTKDRPLLVDVTEAFLSGRQSDTHGRSQQSLDSNENVTHKILWYNKPDWMPMINRCLNTCAYRNCESVTNVTLIKQSSAVIFCTTTGGVGQSPPLNQTERPADQAWVFFEMESPIHLNTFYTHLRPSWINSFNWSMNYRLDSDIISPYGFLSTRKILPERNYTYIFRKKTKFAAWIVSNCHTPSMRETFVEKMKKYGLEIDVFGECGQQLTTDPSEMVNKSYKFYFGFENSLCSDYITEKFFKYFNLNTIVIARGGSDYKRLLPHDTYINTADLKSLRELVNYLKYVGSNETLYTDYLKRKDRYHSVTGISEVCSSFCALCRKLNNLNKHRRVYETIPTYSDTCHKPNDIDALDTE